MADIQLIVKQAVHSVKCSDCLPLQMYVFNAQEDLSISIYDSSIFHCISSNYIQLTFLQSA